ncbi:uncharacterized [Tachysurus ichikawai]
MSQSPVNHKVSTHSMSLGTSAVLYQSLLARAKVRQRRSKKSENEDLGEKAQGATHLPPPEQPHTHPHKDNSHTPSTITTAATVPPPEQPLPRCLHQNSHTPTLTKTTATPPPPEQPPPRHLHQNSHTPTLTKTTPATPPPPEQPSRVSNNSHSFLS